MRKRYRKTRKISERNAQEAADNFSAKEDKQYGTSIGERGIREGIQQRKRA